MEEKNVQKSGNAAGLLEAYEWLESIVTAIVACILIFIFAFRIVNVDGSSMVPTLHDADKVVISRLFYTPKQGDIVVLTQKSFSDSSIVKRVIATGGQTVDIDFEEGVVYVDGVALDEPYIAEKTHLRSDLKFPVTVEEGSIFCMGDNRNRSTDSRNSRIGTIDEGCVLGRVMFRIWPFSDFGKVGNN